jgi:hypothetical protein
VVLLAVLLGLLPALALVGLVGLDHLVILM